MFRHQLLELTHSKSFTHIMCTQCVQTSKIFLFFQNCTWLLKAYLIIQLNIVENFRGENTQQEQIILAQIWIKNNNNNNNKTLTSIHLVLKKRKKLLKLFHADSNFIKAHMLHEISGNKFISSVHTHTKKKNPKYIVCTVYM